MQPTYGTPGSRGGGAAQGLSDNAGLAAERSGRMRPTERQTESARCARDKDCHPGWVGELWWLKVARLSFHFFQKYILKNEMKVDKP